MKKFTLSSIGALIVCLTGVCTARAIEYHVAVGGTDTNPGTAAAPFATIQRAVSMVRPGDIVTVHAGTYYDHVSAWADGTASARIAFRAAPWEAVVLDGGRLAPNTSTVTISGDYVDWSGFEVRNSTKTGISVWEASNVRVFDNTVHHTWGAGIYVGGSAIGLTNQVVVSGNIVHDSCQSNVPHAPSGGWPGGISTSRTIGLKVVGNYVYENHGEGIIIGHATGAEVTDNSVRDNFSVNVYIDNSTGCIVSGNHIYTTGLATFFRDGYPANGISLANEEPEEPLLSDILICNNAIVGGKRCIYYGSYGVGGGLRNTSILNNTCVGGVLATLSISADVGHVGSVVANNIFLQTVAGVPVVDVVANGIKYHHNCWWGGAPGIAAGVADVLADPQLVGPGGLEERDCALRSTSPCQQAGELFSQVIDDYWGTPRSAPYDIGAHELNTSPAVVAAPTNLAASPLSKRRIRLTWLDNATNEIGYTVERSIGGGSWVVVAQLGANATSWTNSGLTARVSYSYRVRAFAGAVLSDYSNTVTAVARN
jgi:parallel beta-helix repeat protein